MRFLQMHFRKAAFALLLVFASAGIAFSQGTGSSVLSAQEALVSEFNVNGLKVIYKRRPGSETVAAGLFIRGGARNIDAKTAGIERLMLASAIEAGKDLPRQTVRRELASIGSQMGSAVSNDYSAVSLVATRSDFTKAFDIFAGVLLRPAFAPDDVRRNKDQILTGLRESVSDPEGALEVLQEKVIYTGHPYANDVNGTPETIASFTPAELAAYHKKVMETSHLLLVFVGDLDAADLQKKIEATFGKLPKGTYKDAAYPAIDFSKPTFDATPRALPTNYVKGVFAAPDLNSPDYYAMQVAMAVLQSLVYQEVRGRLQLSYAPDAELGSFAANTANISASTTDPNAATEAMLDQIRFLKERTLPGGAIDEIASFFLTKYYLNQETSSAQAGDLAKYELIGGGWRRSFAFLNGIKSVTPAQIQEVSNRYMKNIRYLYVGDINQVKRSIFVGE